MSKLGILLINLGTPDHADPKSVRTYLTEFLNDPRVIDIHPILRTLLVNLIIIPFRYKKTAAAYQKIWREDGSPLLIYSNLFKQKLAETLGNDYKVEVGMRYGNPSIKAAIQKLSACSRILILPLFPQYASAATGSALEKALQLFSKHWNIPEITAIRDFYNNQYFIQANAEVIKQYTQNQAVDMLLFSYHGLPERHIKKSNCQAVCDRNSACPRVIDTSLFCYRAQCYETSTLIAQKLDLNTEQYTTAFQSRLGKTPWIIPYTDLLLPELIKKGVKNIAVACPSFVADCLETLEEVNIRTREQWQKLGGENFIFIPCLNDSSIWVKGLSQQIQEWLPKNYPSEPRA